MARVIGKLTAIGVSRAKAPGLYGDGGGLYLQVAPGGARAWVYRFMLAGRARGMGLGPLHTVGLAEARAKGTECRRLRLAGVDPIEARRAARMATRVADAKGITFRKASEAYIKSHRAGWRNPKHAAQWTATLTTYAHPIFGDLPVEAVDTALVTQVLEPIWATKSETASRVRGRIEAVLDWAKVHGYRTGENPARWKGHLDHVLPAKGKVRRVEHHAALPYVELPAFMTALGAREGIGPRALEFAILTAARTGEVIGATWDEIDLDRAMWAIPASRMKGDRDHRVPLAPEALAVLSALRATAEGAFVFPGGRRGKPLSNMGLLMTLRRMGRADLTAHGFRSSFRDWVAERTAYPGEIAEAALAHVVGDRVEAAYKRTDFYEKRARLMGEWAKYCASGRVATAEVVPLKGAAR